MRKLLNRPVLLYSIIFLFTIFSGAIRKWLITNIAIGNIIFSFQLIVLFLFGLGDGKGVIKVFRHLWLVAYTIYLILLAFSPMNLTVFHGLFGFLLHFGFWFACFYYIEHRDGFDFRPILTMLVMVAAGEMVLAFIQYQLPPDNFLNRYANEQQVGGNIAVVGTAAAVRVTGTFSYISGFSAYLLFHAYFVWALVKLNYRPFITIGLMIFGLVAAFMNGSRGATYVYLLIMIFFLVFEAKNSNIARFVPRLIIPGLILYLVILARGSIGVENNVSTAFDNFQDRRETLSESGEEKSRILVDYYALSDFRGKYPYFGIGLGSTYQGALSLFGSSEYLKEYGLPESELTRIVVEGGFVLLAFRLIMAISFCSLLAVNLPAKFFIGALFFITPTVFNIYNAIFSFLGVALIDNIYYREKRAKL